VNTYEILIIQKVKQEIPMEKMSKTASSAVQILPKPRKG
jgi:hypothetical protein